MVRVYQYLLVVPEWGARRLDGLQRMATRS
jgi:hypothetical protein